MNCALILLSGLGVAIVVQAQLRFPCSQLVTERFDPLVNPGQVSPHLHQVIGGNAFNLTMDQQNDLPKLSTCTTCRFKEDFSNYWTAVMFFKHRNGSYIRVPQMANQATGNPNGGMTVYYFQPFNNETVTAFKKGFRMIVGDPMIRNNTFVNPDSGEARALSFRCFDANFTGPSTPFAPGNGYDTADFPKQKCAGGIRANIYFPSCWDGVNLDSKNHHSHVAYPLGPPDASGLYYFGGSCPASHPVRVPLLFMETMWDTRAFNDLEWSEDGTQPLVFSMGDPTGYGQHADYVFGWEGDSLQRAMDKCIGGNGVPESCKELTLNTDDEMNQCIQAPRIDEVTEGQYLAALPGCNPIQDGPTPATAVTGCTAISTTTVLSQPTGNPSKAHIKPETRASVDVAK